MMRALGIPLLFLLIFGCSSPMNRRTTVEKSDQDKIVFSDLKVSAAFQWVEGPVGSVRETNSLLVVLRDLDGSVFQLPEGWSLEFYSEMPSMGHPLDDEGHFNNIGSGIYLNTTIRFNMGGDWLHSLRIKEDRDIIDEVVWNASL